GSKSFVSSGGARSAILDPSAWACRCSRFGKNLTLFATTSNLLFCTPSVSHFRSRSLPSTSTGLPLLKNLPQLSACFPNTTALIKSTSSFVSSPCLYLELTAIEIVVTGVPPGVYRTSGSLVRFPIRMIRLNIGACLNLCWGLNHLSCTLKSLRLFGYRGSRGNSNPKHLFWKCFYLFTAESYNHEFEDRVKNLKETFDLADRGGRGLEQIEDIYSHLLFIKFIRELPSPPVVSLEN